MKLKNIFGKEIYVNSIKLDKDEVKEFNNDFEKSTEYKIIIRDGYVEKVNEIKKGNTNEV